MIFGTTQHNPPSRFLSEIEVSEIAPTVGSRLSNGFDQEPHIEYEMEMIDLQVGDAVKHAIFGHGVVTHIDDTVVTVAFRGKGIKKLNVAFAPLEKVA